MLAFVQRSCKAVSCCLVTAVWSVGLINESKSNSVNIFLPNSSQLSSFVPFCICDKDLCDFSFKFVRSGKKRWSGSYNGQLVSQHNLSGTESSLATSLLKYESCDRYLVGMIIVKASQSFDKRTLSGSLCDSKAGFLNCVISSVFHVEVIPIF